MLDLDELLQRIPRLIARLTRSTRSPSTCSTKRQRAADRVRRGYPDDVPTSGSRSARASSAPRSPSAAGAPRQRRHDRSALYRRRARHEVASSSCRSCTRRVDRRAQHPQRRIAQFTRARRGDPPQFARARRGGARQRAAVRARARSDAEALRDARRDRPRSRVDPRSRRAVDADRAARPSASSTTARSASCSSTSRPGARDEGRRAVRREGRTADACSSARGWSATRRCTRPVLVSTSRGSALHQARSTTCGRSW